MYLVDYSQLPWSVPGSEIVGSAKLRKCDHENKTGGNCGATSPLHLDHTLIFSRTFHLHGILRLGYSSPNGELVKPLFPMNSN